jgi:hypothetical protein
MRQVIEKYRSNRLSSSMVNVSGFVFSLLLSACSLTNTGGGSSELSDSGGTVPRGGASGGIGSSDVASTGGSAFVAFSTGPLDGTWLLDGYINLNGPTIVQPDYIPIVLTINGSSGFITANFPNDGGTLGCSCAMNTQLVINYPADSSFNWLYTSEDCVPSSCDTKCYWGGGVIISCSASDYTQYAGSYTLNDDGSVQMLLQPNDGPWTIVDFNKITANNPAATDTNSTSGVDAGAGPTAGGIMRIASLSSAGNSEFVNGQVSGVDTSRSGVIVYALVSGGWYNKPDYNSSPWPSPITMINADGTWSTNITPEANEPPATKIAAYLVPLDYNVPLPNGDPSLPSYFNGLPSACINPQIALSDASQLCP